MPIRNVDIDYFRLLIAKPASVTRLPRIPPLQRQHVWGKLSVPPGLSNDCWIFGSVDLIDRWNTANVILTDKLFLLKEISRSSPANHIRRLCYAKSKNYRLQPHHLSSLPESSQNTLRSTAPVPTHR